MKIGFQDQDSKKGMKQRIDHKQKKLNQLQQTIECWEQVSFFEASMPCIRARGLKWRVSHNMNELRLKRLDLPSALVQLPIRVLQLELKVLMTHILGCKCCGIHSSRILSSIDDENELTPLNRAPLGEALDLCAHCLKNIAFKIEYRIHSKKREHCFKTNIRASQNNNSRQKRPEPRE